MAELWGDAEIRLLREHVQGLADDRDANKAACKRLRNENENLRATLEELLESIEGRSSVPFSITAAAREARRALATLSESEGK